MIAAFIMYLLGVPLVYLLMSLLVARDSNFKPIDPLKHALTWPISTVETIVRTILVPSNWKLPVPVLRLVICGCIAVGTYSFIVLK